MPDARVFIDSNTFLYTVDEFETEKRNKAQDWLTQLAESNQGVTNLQVLNEIASVAARKPARFGEEDPFFRIDSFSISGFLPMTLQTSIAARSLYRRHRYSWWDCLLLASAVELGCSHFLSEDLQDGHAIQGLTIVDPFAHSPERILTRR